MKIETEAHARAGILGNPSDGYFGNIIAITVKNFRATVTLSPSKELTVVPRENSDHTFENLAVFRARTKRYGYYGGDRLVKAALMTFLDYCENQGISLDTENFSITYSSDIPRQVGLAGSSAIITASIRAFMQFYHVDIPREILPSLILNAEVVELGINAGYMDRVVQVYEGCMYMDLDEALIRKRGYGKYEPLDPALLPPFYLAYKTDLGKVSGKVLNPIRVGYDRKDPLVLRTLERIASLAEMGREALLRKDTGRMAEWMNENFDLRSRIMPISEANMELIRRARACGCSAKFAGSGGSIIGTYPEEKFGLLKQELESLGATVIVPRIV